VIGEARLRRAGLWAAVLATVAIPFAVLAAAIALGVNVPYADEFAYQGFLYRAYLHELTLGDLWRYQNSEHRIFVNTLVFWLLAQWGGWDVVREQCFSVATLVATQLALWRIVLRTVAASYAIPALLAVSVALYDLAQADNLAWGFQMAWYVADAALVAAVMLLTHAADGPRRFAAAVAVAALGSLTMTQGLLIWPVGLACLLVLGAPRRRAVAWSIAGVAVSAIVRIGIRPAPTVPHTAGAQQALDVVHYALAYLGAPLAESFGPSPATAAGALALAVLGALLAADLRAPDRRARIARRSAWYAIAAYALAAALLTAYGRVGYGVDQAISGRYVTLSALFEVGILGALATFAPFPLPRARALALGLAAAIVLCLLQQSVAGARTWRTIAAQRHADFDALARGDASGAADLWPDPRLLNELLLEMEEARTGIFAR
jgi:hypothetical protein